MDIPYFLLSETIFSSQTKHVNFEIYSCINNCNCHDTRMQRFLEIIDISIFPLYVLLIFDL